MNKVLVYGTLREGFGNYNVYLRPQKPIEIVKVRARMFDVGYYPYILLGGSLREVICECYDITDQDLERLDRLEGHPFLYTRQVITVNNIEYNIYVGNRIAAFGNHKQIFSGDWRQYMGETK